jgi:hypothetical protein
LLEVCTNYSSFEAITKYCSVNHLETVQRQNNYVLLTQQSISCIDASTVLYSTYFTVFCMKLKQVFLYLNSTGSGFLNSILAKKLNNRPGQWDRCPAESQEPYF